MHIHTCGSLNEKGCEQLIIYFVKNTAGRILHQIYLFLVNSNLNQINLMFTHWFIFFYRKKTPRKSLFSDTDDGNRLSSRDLFNVNGKRPRSESQLNLHAASPTFTLSSDEKKVSFILRPKQSLLQTQSWLIPQFFKRTRFQ